LVKKEENIPLPKCEYNPEEGEVICKVDESLYEKIKSGKIVKRISFEVQEKK
jgi:hypothetical protein